MVKIRWCILYTRVWIKKTHFQSLPYNVRCAQPFIKSGYRHLEGEIANEGSCVRIRQKREISECAPGGKHVISQQGVTDTHKCIHSCHNCSNSLSCSEQPFPAGDIHSSDNRVLSNPKMMNGDDQASRKEPETGLLWHSFHKNRSSGKRTSQTSWAVSYRNVNKFEPLFFLHL